MSDGELGAAYARSAYIDALNQHNENLHSWKVYARKLEGRIQELEERNETNLYHLGGALGTASEEGMRKRALFIYLKTINQAIKLYYGDQAKQIATTLSPANPRFLSMLENNLREDNKDKLVNGNFVTDTKVILNKLPATKKGYQDVIKMYHDVNGKKVPSLSFMEPSDASIGYETDTNAGVEFVKRVSVDVAN